MKYFVFNFENRMKVFFFHGSHTKSDELIY